ncbi:hypothetical protein GGR28_000307 [Lewinella aquimaris]|uniref:Pyridoxamine 5'-phosphate oxidase Alr4036 family FMN-binding domain-containing protein n=1 Tax=Neolewinella aquimaris TaxID=1835722 RepID=A0A840E9J3_9BACT|nr:hypothetical protein [Neolewinella aquimaris]MBB4077706.1 hypothetical protein [Neolewinella aquimaris]
MLRKIVSDDLWKQAWQLIFEALNTPDHPYATPAVATTDPYGVPRLRTVVLRDAATEDQSTLRCYTDIRSVKMDHLRREGAELSWLFWDPATKLQLTCGGPALLVRDEERQRIFSELPKHGRRAYATLLPPAAGLPEAQTGLPADWDERTLAETDYAEANFCVLETQLRWGEVLQLSRQGNARLTATRAAGVWKLDWIVP